MKKLYLVSVFFLLATGAVFSQELELKNVIIQSARSIEETLPQRTMVAVINFDSPTDEFSDYVIEELIDELLRGRKVTIVDRRSIGLILDEMNFQYSGYVSDESMQSIGKMLGAQAIVSGSLTNMGNNYRFRIRIINVETATIREQISFDLENDSQVAYLLGSGKKPRRVFVPTANVRNNWVSGDLGLAMIGDGRGAFNITARYERMFAPKISLGANLLLSFPISESSGYYYVRNLSDEYNDFNPKTGFGVNGFFHFYPVGRVFFFGPAIGFHYVGNRVVEKDGSGNDITKDGKYITSKRAGFSIGPEVGWKIDVGKEGGFFIQPCLSFRGVLGKENVDLSHYPDYPDNKKRQLENGIFVDGYFMLSFGAGWAF